MRRLPSSRFWRYLQAILGDMLTRGIIVGLWIALFLGALWLSSGTQEPPHNRSINLFTWTELVDRRMVEEFERTTGIQVNIAYFESNEELYAKLLITKGLGYDLILPTDYLVQALIKQDLLQPLDRSKLNFLKRLDRRLLGQYFDPDNSYSVPYVWSVYGIGINKKFFPTPPPATWKLLLDSCVTQMPRLMTEDARELALLAAFSLYGTIDGIDETKMSAIEQLLLRQKPFVMAYTDYTAAYLLGSGSVGMALSSSPYVIRAAAQSDEIDFILPTEGTFAMIESFVIPRASAKQELVYEFLNYWYQQQIVAYHIERTYFFPALTDVACPAMSGRSADMLRNCARAYTNFQFFRDVIPESWVNKLWLALKSS